MGDTAHSSEGLFYVPPGLLQPRCRIQNLSLLNFIRLVVAHLSDLLRSLCKAFEGDIKSSQFNIFNIMDKLSTPSSPVSKLFMKALKSTEPKMDPFRTPPVISYQLDVMTIYYLALFTIIFCVLPIIPCSPTAWGI